VVSNPAQGLEECMHYAVFVLRYIGRGLARADPRSQQSFRMPVTNVLNPGKRKALGRFGM
jgi:hypothetical protein